MKATLGLGLNVGLGCGAVSYLLKDNFTDTDTAPMTTPRTCVPGPGTADVTDTGNNASTDGTNFIIGGRVGDEDPNLNFTPSAATGNIFSWSFTQPHGSSYIFVYINKGVLTFGSMLYGGLFQFLVGGRGTFNGTIETFALGTIHKLAVALSGYNAFVLRNDKLLCIYPYEISVLTAIELLTGNPLAYPCNYHYANVPTLQWVPSPAFSHGFTQEDVVFSVNIGPSAIASDGTIYADVDGQLYKSMDGGVSFGDALTSFTASGMRSVWVDSNDNVYCSPISAVSGEKGLHRSTNGGTSWSRVINLSAYSPEITIWGIGEDSDGNIYASTYGSKAIIYKSTNEGASFSSAYDGSATYTHCHNLCVDPANDNVYVTLGDPDTAAIAKYDATGESWSVLTPATTPQFLGCIATPTARLFGYDSSGNGKIYRTTDDSTFTLVWEDLGDYGTGNVINCWWMRREPVTGYLYAGFTSGNNFAGKAKILVSIDDGLTWLAYKRWDKNQNYDGPKDASNISNGGMVISYSEDGVMQPGQWLNLATTMPVSDGKGHFEGEEATLGHGGNGVAVTTVSGTPYIVGSHLIFTTAGIIIADTGAAEGIIKVTFTTPASGTDPAYIIFRYTDTDNYWCVKIIPGTPGNDFQLIEVNAGTPTVRDEDDCDWVASSEYTLHISFYDNKYIVNYYKGYYSQSGTKELTYTDAGSFNVTATKVGLQDSATSNFAFNGLAVYKKDITIPAWCIGD